MTAFLRSRRARVTPADVGMAPGLRRRTPGLRREEVAQLSGVGVTWYTWLEQGRPINASAQVLDAIARTLRLDGPERQHLYHLAEVPQGPDPQADAEGSEGVGPEIQGIIDALEPNPAVVYNERYDILATNGGYDSLFSPRAERSSCPRNALWTLFHMPECDYPLVHPERELPMMVATMRSAYGRHVGEPVWESFIQRLSAASTAFAELWEGGDVVQPGPRVKAFQHPAVGEIGMTSVSLAVNGMPGCRIVVYTPSGDESRRRVALLSELRNQGA
ncbi:XRE family transcriptional regulator [Streptomyces sp. 150FB]|nr:XRE family transcriptional regulator [Streptomyces sp. 150FB]